MGADLPAADDNGLLDPYLKLGFKDCPRQESRKQYDTRDPLFLASFDFAATMSDDLAVAPPVALHLYDSDWGPDPDDFCGIAFVPIQVTAHKDAKSPAEAAAKVPPIAPRHTLRPPGRSS